MQQVICITFDNGLDVTPGPDEKFTWTPGDKFVYHWDKGVLAAAYNTNFIRELSFKLPPENSPPKDLDINGSGSAENIRTGMKWASENNDIISESLGDPPPEPTLNQICTCEDVPDPTCPQHRKREE